MNVRRYHRTELSDVWVRYTTMLYWSDGTSTLENLWTAVNSQLFPFFFPTYFHVLAWFLAVSLVTRDRSSSEHYLYVPVCRFNRRTCIKRARILLTAPPFTYNMLFLIVYTGIVRVYIYLVYKYEYSFTSWAGQATARAVASARAVGAESRPLFFLSEIWPKYRSEKKTQKRP